MNVLATILVLMVIAVAVVFAIVQMHRGAGGCGSCGSSSKSDSCDGVRSGDSLRTADESCVSVKDSRRVSGNKCASCSNHDCPFCN